MRIILSPRITDNQETSERFISISERWTPLLIETFDNVEIIILDFGQKFDHSFVEALKPDLILLTGGADIGTFPNRDAFELSLINWASQNRIKLIGICRGMQLINQMWGGKNCVGDAAFAEAHVSQRHDVDLHDWLRNLMGRSKIRVNSFHKNYILKDSCPYHLKTLASSGNTVEAFISQDALCLGLMWHPEREPQFLQTDKSIIKHFLEKDNGI